MIVNYGTHSCLILNTVMLCTYMLGQNNLTLSFLQKSNCKGEISLCYVEISLLEAKTKLLVCKVTTGLLKVETSLCRVYLSKC